MANPSIIRYIRDTLSGGYTEAQIRDALIKQGWYPEEVDQAMAQVRSEHAGTPQGGVKTGIPPRQSETTVRGYRKTGKKPAEAFRGSFMLTLAGGAVIIINSILVFLQVGDALSIFLTNVDISLLSSIGISLSQFDSFLINMVIGGFLAATSYILFIMPDSSRLTGIFIIALSLIAVMAGNGFMIGGIIAIAGGVMAVLGR